ncbi:MAG TPA: ribonuclease R [Patescibacteria group bacterium]|nr:ribonuclease R [Patescibacteria group bacterium]
MSNKQNDDNDKKHQRNHSNRPGRKSQRPGHRPKPEPSPGLPSKDELRKIIAESTVPVHKRDLARQLGLQGQEKMQLRKLLRELTEEGAVEKDNRKSYKPAGVLPDRMLIEVTGTDIDGELRGVPVDWSGPGAPPVIYVMGPKTGDVLEIGSKILARVRRISESEYEAKPLKAIDAPETTQVVGTFKAYKDGGYVTPTDKKNKEEYFVAPEHRGGHELKDGDVVVIEPVPASSRQQRQRNPARVIEVVGQKDDPRLISLIAIHSHGIPTQFSKQTLAEAEKLKEPTLDEGRIDLRDIPLVTIDGADARDFDDAVFAEPDEDGGWHLVVAIADVSFYVRPGSALDKDAFERGNSTYFADRVVPMLPEQLSNDLCSLRPLVNRACLAVHMYVDKNARLTRWKFVRGLMRSAARLTYEQVQAAQDGNPDEKTGPLMENVIKPLYRAYSVLKRGRELRGALELDLPERKAIIDEKGHLTAVVPRERLAAHQLIEEFMILANVAAAEALEAKSAPCVYRVHDRPSYDRLEATREFLKELGYSLPKSDQLHPKALNHILQLSAEKEDKALVHTMLLRTQSQAIYSPDNLGHFGLALEKYAHFTSPIRRYADLLVHRSLVRAYSFGAGGLTDEERGDLHAAAEHISFTERRSMVAERDVMDRFTAQFLSTNIGKEFKGRVNSVTHFGLFVQLDDTGADGIVPMSYLPRDFYVHDEKRHALVGKNTGRSFRLTDPIIVRLVEADPMRGSTVFEVIDGGSSDGPRGPRMGRHRPPDFRKDERQRKRDGGGFKGKRGGSGKGRGGGKKRR